MVRKLGWRLLVCLLPLALISAGQAGRVDRKVPVRLAFPGVSLKTGQSLKVVLANLSIRPGLPAYPPSPCVYSISVNGEPVHFSDGESVGSLEPGDLESVPVDTAAGETQVAIELDATNARDCSGVIASIEVKQGSLPVLVKAPHSMTGRIAGQPNLNGAASELRLLAPVDLAGGPGIHVRLANVSGDIGHAFPPSPCVYQVQAVGGGIGALDASLPVSSVSGTLGLGGEANFTVGGEGVVAIAIRSAHHGCSALTVSGQLLDSDGLGVETLALVAVVPGSK